MWTLALKRTEQSICLLLEQRQFAPHLEWPLALRRDVAPSVLADSLCSGGKMKSVLEPTLECPGRSEPPGGTSEIWPCENAL